MTFHGGPNEPPTGSTARDCGWLVCDHCGAGIPHGELAARIDQWVDLMTPWLHRQSDQSAREGYADMLVGLAHAAQALRTQCGHEAREAGSERERLETALHSLRRAAASAMRFPSGRTWRDLNP
ncbi:hypothetical protein [Actinophytocola xanthii]|uniref:Uncharacterized protein n=1 Tax=Actinophytocola xanthii TaxID=1912961 RepID=A0A1Q8CTD6_9PSEU|nr:hypothetical protein [Actinophytocola xanthii]OLF17626.1 hypothetical protein BU204_10440 [Actinophytocola xanthii]